MKIEMDNDAIRFQKELNQLDQFVVDFTSILKELNIPYVIISGYVSILFGRNRASEDIDIFIKNLDYTKFMTFWEKVNEEFECIITSNLDNAFNNYLLKGLAIRFARNDEIIPNTVPPEKASFCLLLTALFNKLCY